jgi:cob(I)alamin adenosyltransferase
MSIATKRRDGGWASKSVPRVEGCGAIDKPISRTGLDRLTCRDEDVRENLINRLLDTFCGPPATQSVEPKLRTEANPGPGFSEAW